MKILTCLSLIFILFYCCDNSKGANATPPESQSYQVKTIDSVNNWYTIYATKNDSTYKIVVQKQEYHNHCQSMITIGQSYKLILHSRKNAPLEIIGEKVKPVNSLDVQCYAFDDSTNICIDTKNGVYDLYSTNNFKGLCYVEDQPQ